MSRSAAPGPGLEAGGGQQQIQDSVVLGDVIQVSGVTGNVTVTTERSPYLVERFAAAAVALPVASARAQPSRLLLARHEIVPFVGREVLLRELADWLRAFDAVSVRLVHAPGGQGKTRLARRFAADARAEGWDVWRIGYTATPTIGSRTSPPEGHGLVAVVDYADRWPASALLALVSHLRSVQLHAEVGVRLLLLARSAGFWWRAFRDRLDSDFAIDATSRPLPPVSGQVDRSELYRTAQERFAAALDVTGTEGLPVPDTLDDGAFATVLAVHMAALVAVDAHRLGRAAPTEPHALSAYLLRREHAHWYALHARAEERLATGPRVMARAVYVATLTGGALRRAEARDALAAVHVTAPDPDTVIDDHAFCYPPRDPDTVLEAIHPDRLGEDLIALTTPGHLFADGDDAWHPDDWAVTAAALLVGTGEQPTWTPAAVTVLTETAHRWGHVAQRVLYPLLRDRPELALAAGGGTVSRLTQIPNVDVGVLEAIEAALPAGRHVDLDSAAAAVARALTRHRLARTDDPIDRARLLIVQAQRLGHAGLWEEALASAEEAAGIYRRTAQTGPAHLPGLAHSLSDLGAYLTELGRHERALVSAEEATDIHRRLAMNDPARLPDLADSLNNLAIILTTLGRHEEAHTRAAETAGIYRRLLKTRPAPFRSHLARALNNLSATLARLGRIDEALSTAKEATDLYRSATRINPAAELPGLAASLHNLGHHLLATGQREAALATAEEAAGIRRRLAATNRTAHLRDLAASLNNLGPQLSAVGRHDEALAAVEEATDIYRELAKTSPAAHLPDLATSLNNLSVDLAQLEQPEHALAAAEEAVEIYRRLAAKSPAAHLPNLGASLNTLGLRLSDLDRPDEALARAEEATRIYRELAAADPTANLPGLARVLNNLGPCLSRVGRHKQAMTCAQETVDLNDRLAEANPAVHLPNLAASLGNLAWVCAQARRNLANAEAAAVLSVSLYRALAEQLPAVFGVPLLKAYGTLADVLDAGGRTDKADALRQRLDDEVRGARSTGAR